MALDKSIDDALRSSEPVARLRTLVRQWMDQGKDKAAILGLFEDVRKELTQAGRERDEDAVLDVMDFVTGWCSPHVKL